MSSSQSDKRSSVAKMGKLAQRKAEKDLVLVDTELPSPSVLVVTLTHESKVQVMQDAGVQAGTGVLCVPDTLAQPSYSSTTSIPVTYKEKNAKPMRPLSDRRDIVLALPSASATPVVPLKGRKRKCIRGNDEDPLQQEGLSLASGLRGRDLAFATIDGGMAVVQALEGKTLLSLQAEETRLSACKGDLAAVHGSFNLILADLKFECFLPKCSEDPEGQDLAVVESGDIPNF
ncbi:unnamed protein product [Eruca vesicaria subsp. sativa]|uniref:Uncharacterized protein n=1 Tax=Eruca vesicaria subsp. sativa TaxID=29727 RepID=A0ABC8LAV6_ERUVS|nr:unnamed protein product [Eruca vesicaria subsp. sativa]